MRKQLDPRIPALINNGVRSNHRSFFVLVGDRGRDQVSWLLGTSLMSDREPPLSLVASSCVCQAECLVVLQEGPGVHNVSASFYGPWLTLSHRKKREAKIKRDIKRGIREANEQDPFELFVAVTDIRYAYYKDSAKILGQTFGMLVLQDYEAITPNLLARTIETVEGGGIVVLLLKTMSSLKQLYTMTMVS